MLTRRCDSSHVPAKLTNRGHTYDRRILRDMISTLSKTGANIYAKPPVQVACLQVRDSRLLDTVNKTSEHPKSTVSY